MGHLEDFCENMMVTIIKGIFSDSNNIFLWHESDDINKNSLFPKSQLIPILHFQVMHDCVFHCSHRLLCWIKVSCIWISVKIALISCWNDFSLIPSRKCASYRGAMKICKKYKFWQFWERPLFGIREYAFKLTQ